MRGGGQPANPGVSGRGPAGCSQFCDSKGGRTPRAREHVSVHKYSGYKDKIRGLGQGALWPASPVLMGTILPTGRTLWATGLGVA